VRLLLGHDRPYEPLRETRIPAIEGAQPAAVARLDAPCRRGQFNLYVRNVQVRWSDSSLWVAAVRQRRRVAVVRMSRGIE